jgi:hypothetical protein
MRQEPWASVSSLWAEAVTAQRREEREFILLLSVEFEGARRAAAKALEDFVRGKKPEEE